MRLIDHLFSQPSLAKLIASQINAVNEYGDDKTTTERVKKAMEAVTAINEALTQRETKIRELEREVRKYESLLSISEKERVMS